MKFSILILSVLFPLLSSALVWQETETWNSDWEKKYSEWFESDYNADFFIHGHMKDIPIDCADAVYLPRLYFSYINKLPFMIKNPYLPDAYYTNQSTNFDTIEDELDRVRAFAKFLGDKLQAYDIVNDTYPVAINRDNIKPGTTVWTFANPGHQKTNDKFRPGLGPTHGTNVKEVTDFGTILTIGSSSPRKVKELSESSDFSYRPSAEYHTGLRNWKWPQHYQMNESELPGYSEEQYSNSFSRNTLTKSQILVGNSSLAAWLQELTKRLGNRKEDSDTYMKRMAKNFCSYVKTRVPIVLDGEQVRQSLDGQCMNDRQADDYSTPTRDTAIKRALKKLIDGGSFGNALAYAFGIRTKKTFEKLRPYLEECGTLEIAPGQIVDYVEIAKRVGKGKFSSDPNQTLAARWGEESTQNNKCKY